MHTSAISLSLPVDKTTHVPASGDFQNKKEATLFGMTHSRPSDVLSTPMPSFTPLTKEPWQAGEWKRRRWDGGGGSVSKLFQCTFVTVSKDCPRCRHFAREQDTLWRGDAR